MVQRALMLSRAGQCGIDTTKATLAEVHAVATMDRPEKYSHLDLSESLLYSASTLHLHGLLFDYDALRCVEPPDSCPVFSTALTDPLQHKSLHKRLYSWQSHMGRCGGGGRRTEAHEVVKLVIKRLALCNHDRGALRSHPTSSSSKPCTLAATPRVPETCTQSRGVYMRKMQPRMLSFVLLSQNLAYYTHPQARILLYEQRKTRSSLRTCGTRSLYNTRLRSASSR